MTDETRSVSAAVLAVLLPFATAMAQQRETHITIPYLANATEPAALDYSAARCDIAADDRSMTCQFRQVFVTPTSIDPTSCAITTSGYDQVFRRESPVRWVSAGAPEGECAVVETTILDDGGTTRWTLTIAKRATRNLDRAECRSLAPDVIYDWKTIKRRLPCTTIQPGAIER